jgi:hypothetical protein
LEGLAGPQRHQCRSQRGVQREECAGAEDRRCKPGESGRPIANGAERLDDKTCGYRGNHQACMVGERAVPGDSATDFADFCGPDKCHPGTSGRTAKDRRRHQGGNGYAHHCPAWHTHGESRGEKRDQAPEDKAHQWRLIAKEVEAFANLRVDWE